MNPGFLIIGAIIFSIYLYFMFSNIYLANKKQKEENYPNLSDEDILEAYEDNNK